MSDDPFYRYKRPVVTVEKTKRKIILSNMADVCKSIGRELGDVKKVLGKRLGRAVKIKDGQLEFPNFGGNDLHENVDDIIEEYIERHVICQKCDNPETILGKHKMTCKACGAIMKILT